MKEFVSIRGLIIMFIVNIYFVFVVLKFSSIWQAFNKEIEEKTIRS
jgi:hypothetical protein